ncbi:MAG: hypothetical protein Q8L64_00890, partial [bacterium]|nr:hypothetical protein [bacterium]
MADNALVRILTALLKHQVKKIVGEDALGVIGQELIAVGGDKLDEQIKTLLGEKSTAEELEKAAVFARDNFRGKINDDEIEQWMVMLPLDNLPTIISAIEELPTSPDESKLENALQETVSLNWKKLSAEQVNNAVNSYMFCLRSALLPIEKQTLMVVGRSVLRTEERVNLLLSLFERYIINDQERFQRREKRKRKSSQLKINKKYDEEIPSTNTIIKEGNFLQIVVSQMFRLADLLTYPEGVKEKKFYEIITDSNKYRRFLNRKKGYELKPYGALKPAIMTDEHFNTFWKTAIPDLRKDVDPLRFIPFELDLSNHLKTLRPDPGSVLESAIKGNLDLIKNIQINGSLRIYPPGTGIICMKLTLEFTGGIHVEISGELARNIESLLFVDPNNSVDLGKPSESIFLEIIDKVAETFFKDEMFTGAERRWQPPETMYNFRDFHGNQLDEKVSVLARLMSYAPANNEDLDMLERRIVKSINSSHWQKEKVFSAVGEGVALVIIPTSDALGKKESQKKLLDFFINTRELITAASYATKSFEERLDEFNLEYKINVQKKGNEKSFEELFNLLSAMQRVMLAVSTIRGHLHRLGKGEL